MKTSCIVCLKITYMVEIVIFHTACTRDGKIEDITFTQHHSDDHIQTVISDALTIGGQLSQVISFIILIHVSIPIMSFTCVTLMKITSK